MGIELLGFATEHLSRIWHELKLAFLIPLPIAAMSILWAYLWMRPRSLRSWRDLREFLLPAPLFHARTLKMDVVAFVFSYILLSPITSVFAILISAELVSGALFALLAAPPATIAELWIVIPIQLGAALLIGEVSYWVGHHLHHKVQFLWELHKVHHSSEALAYVSGERQHPLEALLTMPLFAVILPAIFIGAVLYFTGGHLHPVVVSALLVYRIAIGALARLHHSPVSISFGRLSRVFSSPAVHHIHHSAELKHRDKNFGAGLAIFDWMFGTLYVPAEGEKFRFGTDESELGESNPHLTAKGFFLSPAIGFGRGLVASILPGRRHDSLDPQRMLARSEADAAARGG